MVSPFRVGLKRKAHRERFRWDIDDLGHIIRRNKGAIIPLLRSIVDQGHIKVNRYF